VAAGAADRDEEMAAGDLCRLVPPAATSTRISAGVVARTAVAAALHRISMSSPARIAVISAEIVGVLAGDEPVGALDDGDGAAEAAVHLRELETDVAAADHDEVRRQDVELHDRLAGEKRCAGEPGIGGTTGRAPILRKMRSPVTSRSATRSVCGSTKAGGAFDSSSVRQARRASGRGCRATRRRCGPCAP